MYNRNMPSVFVTEMLGEEDSEQLLCPVCKNGILKIIKEGVSSNGTQYRNYVCSNSISGCRFFWRIFFDDEEEIKKKYHNQMDRYFEDKKWQL